MLTHVKTMFAVVGVGCGGNSGERRWKSPLASSPKAKERFKLVFPLFLHMLVEFQQNKGKTLGAHFWRSNASLESKLRCITFAGLYRLQ